MRERKKRCGKCGGIKTLEHFDPSDTSEDGHQSYCKLCKRALGKRRRQRNVAARLRHHIATRVATQLGDLTPPNMTAKLEELLGYNIRVLTRTLSEDLRAREGKKLRDALEEGYHVDHKIPLSFFKVVTANQVNWQTFRECWAVDNLRAIPASENLAKGSKME